MCVLNLIILLVDVVLIYICECKLKLFLLHTKINKCNKYNNYMYLTALYL